MEHEYEMIPHTADLKIRAYGATLEDLFRNAMRGMFASIHPIGTSITYKDDKPVITKYQAEHTVVVHADDRELLLVDFLSECLYLSDVHNEAYFDAKFSILSQSELEATLYGVKIERFEVVEIKAVTYHDLELVQVNGIWQATIVFDI